MQKKLNLTWDRSLRQFVKQIAGKKYYFGTAKSKQDAEGYARALAKYREFMAARLANPATKATPKQLLSQTDPATTTNPTRALGRVVKDYLKYQWDRTIDTGGGRTITAGRVIALTNWIKPFVEVAGENRRINSVDENLILTFRANRFDALRNKQITAHTLFQHFAVVKHFLKWCWENRKLRNLPRNLNTALKFGLPASEIKFFNWKDGEVQRLLKACAAHSEELELYALLGLNCGFTLKDISDLRMIEVKWKKVPWPVIIRSRSKTGQYSRHVLWKRTFELFKRLAIGKYGTEEPCFLRKDGRKLMIDGGGKLTNRIHGQFRAIMNETFGKEDRRSFRHLRKTGATFLSRRKDGIEILYLAHAPNTMASKFYALNDGNQLDMWLCYMETDFGLVDKTIQRWKSGSPEATPQTP